MNDKEKLIIDIKKNVSEYSNNTLKMEENREKNLFKTASSIVTCISILSVSLMSLIVILLDKLPKLNYLIVIFSIILFLTLFTSLIFAIKAHWLYKKEYTRTGHEYIEYINNHINDYLDANGFLDQKINDNDKIIESLEKNNNARKNDLIVSTIILFTFMVLIIIFGIVILVLS